MTLKRFVVRVYDSEALAVAFRPLEVIEQRPSEVAFKRYAGLDQTVALNKMLAEVRRAQYVMNLVFRRQNVIVASAVLRNIDRRIAVFWCAQESTLNKPSGVDVPAHVRAVKTDLNFFAVEQAFILLVTAETTAVEVNADEVDLLGDRLHVSRQNRHFTAFSLEPFDQAFRVRALERRLHEPFVVPCANATSSYLRPLETSCTARTSTGYASFRSRPNAKLTELLNRLAVSDHAMMGYVNAKL